jgi:uncharacterized membrane protein YkvA (DUF1232 family)
MSLSVTAKIHLLWRMVRDPRVPLRAKSVLPAIGLYVAMPSDRKPEFIPGLGQLDDLLVVALGLALFLWMTPRYVVEEHLSQFE